MRASIASLIALPGKEFVNRCYVTLLGREIDTEGLLHYNALIEKGRDKRSILRDILASSEFRTRHGNPRFAVIYRQLFALSKLPLLGPFASAIRVRQFELAASGESAFSTLHAELLASREMTKQTLTAMAKLEKELAAHRTSGKLAAPMSADVITAGIRDELRATHSQTSSVRDAIAKLEKEFATIRTLGQGATHAIPAPTPSGLPMPRDNRVAAERLLALIEQQIQRH
ncbi:DUF4214 domain-containing protein [Paraburkholderia sp. J67]|uniref:DUF4214 domain-containing protein n=1 Tax=Paraburkholderia sp. J67 TaxID=2805435 RepID=UPI002ABD171D|nr:DUF4214 domain-containing protein [Paraburkholderia sp. J67]